MTQLQTRFSILIARVASVLLVCLCTWAVPNEDQQKRLGELSLEELGNVEVTTASRSPEQAWKTPAAVYVITQDDIQRSGVTTVPEALRLAPGVEVARIDSNKWSIGIRGFGSRLSRDVLVLVDGRTVYTTLLAGTYWEVQNVMIEDVDRIEVIRGPGATIWGPNAVNGVINIITKAPADTKGVMVSTRSGTLRQGGLDVRYGGSAGDVDYRVYVMGYVRGPEYHIDRNNYDQWRAAQGGFRLDWAANARDEITFQGDLYDEGAGETVSSVTYSPPGSRTVEGTALLSGGNFLTRWTRKQGEGRDLQVQMYYDRTNRTEPNFADYRDTIDLDFVNHLRFTRQQFSWGAGARFSRGTNPTIVSGLYFLPHTRTDQLWTAFFQDEIEVVPNRLVLSLGTKLLKTNYTGPQFQPSVRLLWTPNDKNTVWTAFTHAVRTPSAAERAFYLSGFIGTANGLPFFARFNANPNFRSEQLNGYEAGYRRLFTKTLYFDTALFFNHYNGLFSEDITGAPFIEDTPAPTHILLPAEFGNGLLGTTKGIEVGPEWKPFKMWRVRATYSYVQMSIKKTANSQDIGSGPIVEGSSPKHEATLLSGLDLGKHFSFDATYRYVSQLNKLSVPAYSTADARFDWLPTSELKLSVVARNLLQPRHLEFASDPAPNVAIKRSVYGQITWTK
jgi:iron complex outermembrane recepter protein